MRAVSLALTLWVVSATASAQAQGSAPRLLPPANEFRLTLRELSKSETARLPPGTACLGEAAHAFPCRAVSLTLENVGSHIVRLSGLTCSESEITIDRVDPRSSSGWWPVSTGISKCERGKDLPWTNTRLRPGEHTTVTSRLISSTRSVDSYPLLGEITLRAVWTLKGCTDSSENADCLSPLQHVRTTGSWPDIDFQQAIFLTSNEINTTISPLPDPGPIHLSFKVDVLPNGKEMPLPANAVPSPPDSHCPAGALSAECITFHYTVQNLGSQPVRHGTLSCSGSSITPEYRTGETPWKPLPERMWACAGNVFYERVIPAGGSIDGYFTLRHLTPAWNVNSLRMAGTYRFRFAFWPIACVAAPDGSFCLVPPKEQPKVYAPEVVVDASAALGEPEKDSF